MGMLVSVIIECHEELHTRVILLKNMGYLCYAAITVMLHPPRLVDGGG